MGQRPRWPERGLDSFELPREDLVESLERVEDSLLRVEVFVERVEVFEDSRLTVEVRPVLSVVLIVVRVVPLLFTRVSIVVDGALVVAGLVLVERVEPEVLVACVLVVLVERVEPEVLV